MEIQITLKSPDNKIKYYEAQYDAISDLLREINPCDIRIVDGIPQCTGIRTGDADADEGTLCCTGCNHLNSNGCMVKALGCKMWLCTAAINHILGKYTTMPDKVLALIKKIQETHRVCEFFGISCRARHSMRENMDGILNEDGFKESHS
jgi:hypothetical protein